MRYFDITSRMIWASVGSYAIASLSNLASLALPFDRISTIYWGYLISTIVWALVVLWVFWVKKIAILWLSLLSVAGLLLVIWWYGAAVAN